MLSDMGPLLSFADTEDIDDFVAHLRKYEQGEMTADEFKRFRLGRGTYGQRQEGVNMLRVKVPQGVLSAQQVETVARVADEFSRGFGHVTTRQNIQLHFCKLERVPEAMRILADAGLTTKEACGNTVRNVTACALAGVCQGAPFDVTPYGRAVTRHFLRNPICQALPRKFKIALSGCGDDCAQGAINDIGLVAMIKDNVRGFRVRVGGGLSTSPEDAHPLEDFVPGDRLLPTLEAVVRVFDRTGNRDNKSRARLKYVIRKIGMEALRREYQIELEKIAAEGRATIPIDTSSETEQTRPDAVLRLSRPPVRQEAAVDGFGEWFRSNCVPQKQAGYYAVLARLERGDVTSAQLRAVAELSRRFGEGELRTTNEQNLLFRFVPEASLSALHAELTALGLGRSGARTIHDVTSCPGADTCNLAVTRSRELSTAVSERLATAGAALEGASRLDVKISGCPNSCGQHHVAALGFHGTMRRVGGQAVPEYQLHLGGGIDGRGAVFGRQVVKVPARRVPEAVVRLLELYQRDKQPGERALEFFRRVDEKVVKAAVADLAAFDEKTARAEEWLDHGDETPFKVVIGQGECAS
jgi:sulfite reductase beta subunit-like hemoprotein